MRASLCLKAAILSPRLLQYINVFSPLSSGFPMSYHRVLPPPPALASQTPTAQWLPKQDTLLQNRIMADNDSRPDESIAQHTSPVHVPTSPSPTADRHSPQPSEASVEDVATSSNIRTRSSATNESNNPSDQRALSITQEDTVWNAPSSVCLCQPDPKVPRPRNGNVSSLTSFLFLPS